MENNQPQDDQKITKEDIDRLIKEMDAVLNEERHL